MVLAETFDTKTFLTTVGAGRTIATYNPYGQKTEPTAGASRRLSMIIAQEPAQSLTALHRPLALPIVYPGKQQDVALRLVVPLGMEMIDIVAQRPPQ
jgi:hypothetical protein